jgi:hypothetical protein
MGLFRSLIKVLTEDKTSPRDTCDLQHGG